MTDDRYRELADRLDAWAARLREIGGPLLDARESGIRDAAYLLRRTIDMSDAAK